jgi:hypothetical protein
MAKRDIEKISEEAIDIAESMIPDNQYLIIDILDEYDIRLKEAEASELRERLHSAIAEELTKWSQEKLGAKK